MKIGIFGGCFNPPHKMHYYIVEQLLAKKIVDKVIVVPTGNNYTKAGLVDANHRLNMLKLMFKGCPNVSISNFEIQPKRVYTYQTLDYFKSCYPNSEICFICGADNVQEITTWKNFEYILNSYRIIAIKRNSADTIKLINDLSKYNCKIEFAKVEENNISSSELRDDIVAGKVCDDLYIFKDVVSYIRRNNLYVNN